MAVEIDSILQSTKKRLFTTETKRFSTPKLVKENQTIQSLGGKT